MQLNISSLVTIALVSLAAATPTRRADPASQCDTGPIQCCNSVQAAGSADASHLLGLLGVVIQDITVPIGITCSPISVVGVGGNSCTTQPVCCKDNSFHGLIAIGCTPININL